MGVFTAVAATVEDVAGASGINDSMALDLSSGESVRLEEILSFFCLRGGLK
jgi:hypothetical protein